MRCCVLIDSQHVLRENSKKEKKKKDKKRKLYMYKRLNLKVATVIEHSHLATSQFSKGLSYEMSGRAVMNILA